MSHPAEYYPQLERNIIAALISAPEKWLEVSGVINANCFYTPTHRAVFAEMERMQALSSTHDLLSLTKALTKSEPGTQWHLTLAQLQSTDIYPVNLSRWATILKERAVRKWLKGFGERLVKGHNDESRDALDLLADAQKDFTALTQISIARTERTTGDLVASVLTELQNPGTTKGLDTGLIALDRVLRGLRPGKLIVLAARPGMGKTSLAQKVAHTQAVRRKVPVGAFTLEMSGEDYMRQLLIQDSQVCLSNEAIADHEYSRLDLSASRLSDAPLYVDDTPRLKPSDIRARALAWKQRYGVKLIILDYLQLVGATNPKASREQQVSEISRELKLLAKEMDVPIIALSQLSREVEKRPGKKPQLSDLRESGSIEQDADQILFLYRPEYYGITEFTDGNPTAGICEAIIAKNRFGPTLTVEVGWNGPTVSFSDLHSIPPVEMEEYEYAKSKTIKPQVEEEELI